MPRLNQERQKELEPKRMEETKAAIRALGLEICYESETRFDFMFRGKRVIFFPYSGWHTGASIKDGRGFNKLLIQLTA